MITELAHGRAHARKKYRISRDRCAIVDD